MTADWLGRVVDEWLDDIRHERAHGEIAFAALIVALGGLFALLAVLLGVLVVGGAWVLFSVSRWWFAAACTAVFVVWRLARFVWRLSEPGRRMEGGE